MSDTETRDQLARIIWDCEDLNRAVLADCEDIADEIISRGWRPAARTVTTVEELDALPNGTVIREAGNSPLLFTFVKEDSMWLTSGSDSLYLGRDIMLPATVLYEPKEAK